MNENSQGILSGAVHGMLHGDFVSMQQGCKKYDFSIEEKHGVLSKDDPVH